jgi:hypothetical protein
MVHRKIFQISYTGQCYEGWLFWVKTWHSTQQQYYKTNWKAFLHIKCLFHYNVSFQQLLKQNLWHNNFLEKADSPLISCKNNFILLSYMKVHSCVHKSLPMDYILQQMHSFPSFTPYSSKAFLILFLHLRLVLSLIIPQNPNKSKTHARTRTRARAHTHTHTHTHIRHKWGNNIRMDVYLHIHTHTSALLLSKKIYTHIHT